MKILHIFIVALLFFGCSAKNSINPLGNAFGKVGDSDPLNLGNKPVLPMKDTASPKPLKLKNQLSPTNNKTPLLSLASNSNLNQNQNFPDIFDKTTDPMMIMAANSVVITVWAINPGNWLWAYSPVYSNDLGTYRVWKFILLPNDEVLILNAKTRTTCVNTYGSGVIHATCDINNDAQKFTLRPMSNGAVQIYNKQKDVCLQTPLDDVFGFDTFGEIALTKCANSLDQQWYLLPPPLSGQLLK